MIYAGYDVLLEDPNRRDDPTHTVRRSKVRIDSLTGPFTEIVKGQSSRQVRPFSWFMESRAAINAFRSFRDARLGRLVPFWVPTWQNDLLLTADVADGADSLIVGNVGYSRFLFDPVTTWRRHVAFIKIGVGIQFVRRIDAAAEGAAVETVTLDSGVTGALAQTGWMLSFLTLCRLNTDLVSLHWHSRTVAEAEFEMIEVAQEMPIVDVTP